MKKNLGVVLGCAVLLRLAGPVSADDPAKVLDDAIRAHGGADKLTRARQMLRTARGTLAVVGMEQKFSEELLVALPDRYRRTITLESGPRFLTVVNGERGWQVAGGATRDLGKHRLREVRTDAYLLLLATLVPQRTEKRFTRKAIPDVQVQGKKAVGVRVSCKGHDDVSLYFDRDSKLLVLASSKTSVAERAVDKNTSYSAFKDFDGVRLPTKIEETVNGSNYLRLHSVSYKFPKVEDKSFAKP